MRELKREGPLHLTIQPRENASRFLTKLADHYNVGVNYVEGKFNTIRTAKDIKTDVDYIAKSIHKNVGDPMAYKRELDALRQLDHPNIVRLFAVFEDFIDVHLV